MTLGEILRETSQKLKKSGVAEYNREARLLVKFGFGLDDVALIGRERMTVDQEDIDNLSDLVERRMNGEPVSRILGEVEFYGLPFKINDHTLVPRSDTETLIDAVLDDFQTRKDENFRLLDIGTGTGAIIISLLYNMPRSKGTATDIIDKVLEVAKNNAKTNGVAARLNLVKASWCCDVDDKFDIIVSNPPYIKSSVIGELAREVKDYDPLIALDGGEDGLDAFRNIFTGCSQIIAENGRLYLEIGYDQGKTVARLGEQARWKFVRLIKDLGENDRVLVFEK